MNSLSNIDIKILELLQQRELLAVTDNEYTLSNIDELTKLSSNYKLNPSFISRLFESINEETKLVYLQKLISLNNHQWGSQYKSASYLGPKGTYSYEAMSKFCQENQFSIEPICCFNFRDQVSNVCQGITDLAFLPIENTSSGIINDVLDLLLEHKVHIIGEITLHIVHSLLVNDPNNISNIKTIYSHPQPIVQCSNFLHTHYNNVQFKYCDSTADAISKVKELNSPEVAAIGSSFGGQLFGLQPIVSNIANQSTNYTRFVVIAKDSIKVPAEIIAKTSITFTTANVPGSLSKVLDVFRQHQYNMVKLASRPIIGRPWEEQFYVDIIANMETYDAQNAFTELKKLCGSIHILGCYPLEKNS